MTIYPCPLCKSFGFCHRKGDPKTCIIKLRKAAAAEKRKARRLEKMDGKNKAEA